ncbi:potassium channel, sub T, member 2 [Entomortierella lignicola]|nr:potassium channel, sub T, member 2 [Entomortierella lignicola]
MNVIPNKNRSASPASPYPTQHSVPQPPRTTQPSLHSTRSTTSPDRNRLTWPQTFSHDSSENTAYGTNLTWTQRLNYLAHNQYIEPQGFIWDSLDDSMEEVQRAKQMRKSSPIKLISDRKDTSYNALRSTFRLQNAEKRLIRLALDYDIYKAKMMALLNSKARTIIFIMIDLVVDVLFCILYLVEAQYLINKDTFDYPDPKWLFIVRPRPIWILAVAMSSWNLMSAVIRFIFADNKLRFIFSWQTLLDVVTAIPFLLSGAFLPNGQWIYVPYFLRSWSVISRLQRALSIGVDIGLSDQPFDPVKAKLIALVAYFVAILYNGMAAFLYTETMFAPKSDAPHSLGDALYFILITASTVGYGDITPKSMESKVVVMIFIIVALSIVPGLIAGTVETLKTSRSGGGSYIQSRGANGVVKQYLVMIGDFQNAKRVSDMLSGFFNKEFSDSEMRVVFLSRNKPSKEVKMLLDMPMHKNRTTMLVGNGLDEVDLKRCQVRDAGAVFVIPDGADSSDLESEDTMTTLLAWSIHLHAPDTRIFTYNLLPETESFQWGVVEQSMCINDVKQLLLAYNCRYRGSATLILNLLHPSEPLNSYEDGWEAQYGDGTGNEIYESSVPEVFIGWTFAQASWFIFLEFQSILIAVDIFLKHENHTKDAHWSKPMSDTLPRQNSFTNREDCPDGRYHLVLNPGNSYRLGKYDQLVFIAQSPEDMEGINNFTMEQYERLLNVKNSHLNNSTEDFSSAMNMYHTLRQSRASARAAAKRRMEHRIGKKARQETPSHKGPPTLEDVKPSIGTLDKSEHIPTELRPKKMVHRNSRPAWNVALYDDDDDESCDGSSVHRVGSMESIHSSQSPSLGQHQQHDKDNIFNQRQSLEQHNKDEASPIGAIYREECGQHDHETVPISEKRPVFHAVSLAMSKSDFYPSNFERNAAVAAAKDIKQRNVAVGAQNKSSPENIEFTSLSEKTQSETTQCRTSSGAGVGSSSPLQQQHETIHPQHSKDSSHGSAQFTYQPLDDTTFIGQTLVTRSENMDLPLCHLLINPPETIRSLIRDDLSLLKDHIVVCANEGESLYRFLTTLRLAQIPRNDVKTIVVLTANPYDALASDDGSMAEMDERENGSGSSTEGMDQHIRGTWDAILSFPRVYWVVGNCRRQRDLVRAGILGASSIVVMSHRVNGLHRDEFEDSTAIMAHHMIHQTLQQRRLLGKQHIAVEIAKRSNIRFLSMHDLSIPGESRSYDHQHLRRISNLKKTMDNKRYGGFWMMPTFASGQVMVTSLLYNVLFQAYSKTHILDLVKLCCGVRLKQAVEMDQILGIDCSNICLINPPKEFVGKPFLELFQALALGFGMIPLGLYRGPDPDLNNTQSFVFTNPLPGISIRNTDMIYVLKS